MIARHGLVAALVAALLPTAAVAVGLGPLHHRGRTDGPRKGFWLNLSNTSRVAETYDLVPLRPDSDTPEPRVVAFPARPTLAAGTTRRVLVIADRLAPGETFTFRLCAGREPLPTEAIHARVCSTLTAVRVGPVRAGNAGPPAAGRAGDG